MRISVIMRLQEIVFWLATSAAEAMSQPRDVLVKREALDNSCLRSMTEQSSDAIWERRFHRLAALAFSHGVAAAAIAEIDENAAEAEGGPDAVSTLRRKHSVSHPSTRQSP